MLFWNRFRRCRIRSIIIATIAYIIDRIRRGRNRSSTVANPLGWSTSITTIIITDDSIVDGRSGAFAGGKVAIAVAVSISTIPNGSI